MDTGIVMRRERTYGVRSSSRGQYRGQSVSRCWAGDRREGSAYV